MVLPTRIGKYLLEERLGGESPDVAVFRATDSETLGPVVVKVLLEEAASASERFLTVAHYRTALPAHPHFVRTFAYALDEGTRRAYIAQDYVSGPTFAQLAAQAKQLSLWNRVRCGLEAAEAIEHLHALGVAHGGALQPKHFRLDADLGVRLVDLGNAYSDGVPPPPEPGRERARASAAEISADVFAFGQVLRELLWGVRLDEPVPDWESQPVTLRSIVDHCLVENPAKRAASLQVVIERLRAWVDSYPASMFEVDLVAAEKKRLAEQASKDKRGKLEEAWTYGILALSLAAVAGGTVGSQVDLMSLGVSPKPSRLEAMVKLPSGLLVDRSEASVAEFVAFAEATHRKLPSGFASNATSDLPAVNVSAHEAEAYCAWMGKRLPSGDEWLQAVAATPLPKPAAAPPKGPRALVETGSDGASIHHLLDNAAEWVSDRPLPDLFAVQAFAPLIHPPATSAEEWRRIRGGSYLRPLPENKLDAGLAAPARYAAPDVGFRCVAMP